MADEAHYELAKIDDTTLAHISQIDGIGTEITLTNFVAGSEEDHIQAFMDELRPWSRKPRLSAKTTIPTKGATDAGPSSSDGDLHHPRDARVARREEADEDRTPVPVVSQPDP